MTDTAIRDEIERDITEYTERHPVSCPSRDHTIRMLHDAMAELIADDVVAGETTHPHTIARYAELARMRYAAREALLAREGH